MDSFRVGRRIFATVPDEQHVRVMADELEIRAAIANDSATFEALYWGERLSCVVVDLQRASGGTSASCSPERGCARLQRASSGTLRTGVRTEGSGKAADRPAGSGAPVQPHQRARREWHQESRRGLPSCLTEPWSPLRLPLVAASARRIRERWHPDMEHLRASRSPLHLPRHHLAHAFPADSEPLGDGVQGQPVAPGLFDRPGPLFGLPGSFGFCVPHGVIRRDDPVKGLPRLGSHGSGFKGHCGRF